MPVLTIRDSGERLEDLSAIQDFLAVWGIWYRHWEGGDSLGDNPSNDEILAAYEQPINALKAKGGYVTADVINIEPSIEGLDVLLAKFSKEHWHAEDEIRFVVGGRGVFHINPKGGPVFSIEVCDGDMINVPSGTLHWFDLCEERAIRAIRLFKDMSGWVPHYSDSGRELDYQPMCFGRTYIPLDK